MYQIRVLLADDHAVLRSGLKVLLDAEPGMRVVGEAGDGMTGLQMARDLRPDVAVVDLAMPSMDGVEVIRRALADNPNLRIVGLSAGGTAAAVKLRQAGAKGFVAKESAFEQLVDAVRTVALGREYLPSLDSIAEEADGETTPHLSPREQEVTRLMADGLATKQIAMQLHVSIKTVETHRRRLMEKLGLDSVAQVTKYAIRQGLTTVQ